MGAKEELRKVRKEFEERKERIDKITTRIELERKLFKIELKKLRKEWNKEMKFAVQLLKALEVSSHSSPKFRGILRTLL